MTRNEHQTVATDLQTALEQIIADFGAWRVSRAVIARLFTRRKQRLRSVDGLSPHLRRDIGLGAHVHAQPRLGQLYY